MKLTLQEIAQLVGGQLHGDPAIEISGADIIRDAVAGQITFVDHAGLARKLHDSPASAVLVSEPVEASSMPSIVVDDVRQAFATVVEQFRHTRPATITGIDPEAYVSRSARIAAGVDIHPHAYVGDDVVIGRGTVVHSGARILAGCEIGEQTVIFPNAVLYENTRLGNRCLVHAGAVLGAYGFGYETIDGKHRKCAQLGNVVVEDDVEIGACTTIDRGSYGSTVIGAGSKLDNQVMIGHNCKIGRHNILCSQVGIAGSCTTGDYVVMAGQVGLKDHIHIGRQAVLGGKAGVKGDVPERSRMVGIPAIPERDFAMLLLSQDKLPEMRKQLKRLEKQVAELEARLRGHGGAEAA